MSLKFESSAEGYNPNIFLFHSPPTDGATESVQWQDYRPTSTLTKFSPIEFNIPRSSAQYIDLKRTRLYIKAKITKPRNVPLDIDDNVAFSNLSLHSIFRQVDVALKQMVISPGVGTCYPYKAYLDTILDYKGNINQGLLQTQMFFKDESFAMDAVDKTGGNAGFTTRWSMTGVGKSVDMLGSICSDICQQDRLIISGVPIRFTLFPHTDSFSLMSDGQMEYEFHVEDALLKVCQVSLNPAVVVGHSEALQKSPALYPYEKSNIKTFTISTGSFSWETDDIYQGDIPSRMLVALTTATAFSGKYEKNPFNFHHHHVNSIGFFVENKSVPSQPLTPNYKSNCFVTSYLTLMKEMQAGGSDSIITRSDYNGGYAIYLFSSNEIEKEEFSQLQRKGHTRLSIKFAEALTEPLTVIVYSKFPGMLTIDQSRNVSIL
jgi:hypothetical protein